MSSPEKRLVGFHRRKQRCPLCRDLLGAQSRDLGVCPSCSTVYHKACYRELGGCAAPACRPLRVPDREGGARLLDPSEHPANPGSRALPEPWVLVVMGALVLAIVVLFIL